MVGVGVSRLRIACAVYWCQDHEVWCPSLDSVTIVVSSVTVLHTIVVLFWLTNFLPPG